MDEYKAWPYNWPLQKLKQRNHTNLEVDFFKLIEKQSVSDPVSGKSLPVKMFPSFWAQSIEKRASSWPQLVWDCPCVAAFRKDLLWMGWKSAWSHLIGVLERSWEREKVEDLRGQFMEECSGYERNKTMMVIGVMDKRFRDLSAALYLTKPPSTIHQQHTLGSFQVCRNKADRGRFAAALCYNKASKDTSIAEKLNWTVGGTLIQYCFTQKAGWSLHINCGNRLWRWKTFGGIPGVRQWWNSLC